MQSVINTPSQMVVWLIGRCKHGLLEMRVLFPPLGGPTTATTMGGGSKGVQSTTGKWSFLVCTSSVRLTDWGTQTLDQNVYCVYICMYEWHSITGQSTWGAPCPACACQLCLHTSLYLLFKKHTIFLLATLLWSLMSNFTKNYSDLNKITLQQTFHFHIH